MYNPAAGLKLKVRAFIAQTFFDPQAGFIIDFMKDKKYGQLPGIDSRIFRCSRYSR